MNLIEKTDRVKNQQEMSSENQQNFIYDVNEGVVEYLTYGQESKDKLLLKPHLEQDLIIPIMYIIIDQSLSPQQVTVDLQKT